MRILFIAPYIPSLIRVRPFNFIKALKIQGHSIFLVCVVQEKKELIELQEIEKYCEKVEKIYLSKYRSYWNCLKYLFSPVALQSAYCFSKKMSKRIEFVLKEGGFDLVHIEHIRAAHFLPEKCSIPAIYDSVDCITALYEQFYKADRSFLMKFISYIEWLKLKCYEPKVLKKFDKIIVTSGIDKKELEKYNIQKPVEIIANGVDLEYFIPMESGIEHFSVIMTGKMSYFANELAALFFLREVWPRITKEIPLVKLYIVGSKPGNSIRKFASSNVIITGYVPDLRTYISNSTAVIAPIVVGAGIQNKILEAMSMAKPIVATSKACESFSIDIKDCLLIKDNPEDFSLAVINVLNDTKFAEILGVKARSFVEQFNNWDEKVKELVKIYLNTIKEKAITKTFCQ